MEIAEAEDHLFERMEAPREAAALHRAALDVVPPRSIGELGAVGIDTNILKMLRRDATFADGLFVTLKANGVPLVVPGQSIVEYWNNHQVFANDEWNGFKSDLSKLGRRLESGSLAGQGRETVAQIEALVEGLSGDLQEAASPEYLEKSRNLIRSLLETAALPRVSRTRFSFLATARIASKTPPGFADEKLKAAPTGDFFVWCDFLLGVLMLEAESEHRTYVWVTEDSKPDWKTAASGHPALIEEFRWVCDGDLAIMSFEELRRLIRAEERNQATAAKNGDEGD